MDCTIYVAKIKALIICLFTVQLILAFVLAYARSKFSEDTAHICYRLSFERYTEYPQFTKKTDYSSAHKQCTFLLVHVYVYFLKLQMHFNYTVSHFSSAPLIKCWISQKEIQ